MIFIYKTNNLIQRKLTFSLYYRFFNKSPKYKNDIFYVFLISPSVGDYQEPKYGTVH